MLLSTFLSCFTALVYNKNQALFFGNSKFVMASALNQFEAKSQKKYVHFNMYKVCAGAFHIIYMIHVLSSVVFIVIEHAAKLYSLHYQFSKNVCFSEKNTFGL